MPAELTGTDSARKWYAEPVRVFDDLFFLGQTAFSVWGLRTSQGIILVDSIFPYEVLESIVRALKPGGRVAFVEYRGEDEAVPIKTLHKMTERQVRLEAGQHTLVWERTSERLPWQHLVVFRKRSVATASSP